MSKKAPLQVYLDESDRDLLERLAEGHGLSMAEAVRVGIRRWAMEEAGEADPLLRLIGGMDQPDLPPDLSTRHDEYAVGRASSDSATRRVAEPRGRFE